MRKSSALKSREVKKSNINTTEVFGKRKLIAGSKNVKIHKGL